jgi:putative DNA primase/helicase
MRQDSFEFRPQFKLTLLGNHAPLISNLDDAIRRRFIIVPFTKKPDKPDPKLEEALRAEWPGILQWAIDGTLDWLANGLIIPDTVIEATTEYFDEQDLLAQWLEACCHVAPNDQNVAGKTAALFGSWEEFAERHGENPGTQRSFNEKMRNRGFVRKKKRLPDGDNTPVFLGLELKQRPYSSE